jgi:glycosyltransferase involved in cell wall biosynthesis
LETRGAFAERIPAQDRVHVLGKRGGFSFRATRKLFHLIRDLRPAIIHSHNIGPLIYATLATFGGLTRPLVHGEHSQLAPWELTQKRLRQRRLLFRACKAVHTVSAAQIEELRQLGFAMGKIRPIPNGVDTGRFIPPISQEVAAARAHFGLPIDATMMGLVGRFGPYKGHARLVESFERIAADFPQARLGFFGAGGSEEQKIRDLVERSPFRDRILLGGFQADPVTAYHTLDALLLPSENEGMSNAALEAMSCGIPVIGNRGCGHEQIFDDQKAGKIVDLSTVENITQALQEVLATPGSLSTMGRAARETVCARFSMTQMMDLYEQLYRAHAAP